MCRLTLGVAQCFFYKPGSREEILAEVEGCDVFCHQAIVDHVHVAVVTRTSVHVVPCPLCCVQNVRNPQPLQIMLVLCSLPARSQRAYYFNPLLFHSV